jgi:hypothetical protein
MAEVVEKLKLYVKGWKAYFKLADTPKIWRELDEEDASPIEGHTKQWGEAQCTENC